jgi:hypothetical protein
MLARSLAVVSIAVTLSLTYAAAASADVPEGWDTPDDPSFMHTLLVLVMIPLAVFVLLALLIYVPPIVRGESVAPAGARADDQWFGGRGDAHESAQKALETRREATDETGGASGSW